MHSNRRSHILKLAQEKLADTSTDGLNMSTDKGQADWVQRAVKDAEGRVAASAQRQQKARAGLMTSDILPHEERPDGSASPDYAKRQIWAGGQRAGDRGVANTAARAAVAPTVSAVKPQVVRPGGPAPGAAPPQVTPPPPTPPPVPYPTASPSFPAQTLPLPRVAIAGK